MDWYVENIEEPIRKEVKLLRENGFNTECSCGHTRYVQCQCMLDGELWRLDKLLYNNGYENYTIVVDIKRIDGHIYSYIVVNFS